MITLPLIGGPGRRRTDRRSPRRSAWTGPHLIAQIVSFGIVCAVLYLFAYRRVLAMLDERRQQIAQGLANAEKIKAELDKTEALRQEVMAKAYAQSARVIEEARSAAARVLEQETQKAISTAEQIMIGRVRPPRRTRSACSANSGARSAAGWFRLPLQ